MNVGFGIRRQNGLLLHVNRDEFYVMGETEVNRYYFYFLFVFILLARHHYHHH